MLNPRKIEGFTLAELMVTIGVFTIFVLFASWILVDSLRSSDVVFEQLVTQNEGRNILKVIINDVRKAENSSLGSYAIETASENELIFYANVDSDTLVERVRLWLDGTTLKKGTIKPVGTPLEYLTENEDVLEIAHNVLNLSQSNPVFLYYDENFSGTEDPLSQPVSESEVRVIRVYLELERDPTSTPAPLHIESSVQLRNLKEN